MSKGERKYNKSKAKTGIQVQATKTNTEEGLTTKKRTALLFEKVILPVIVPLLAPFSSNYFVQRFFNPDYRKPSELEQAKTKIEEVVPKLCIDFVEEDSLVLSKYPEVNIINKLNKSVLNLIRLHGVHEVSEVKGTNLDESLKLTKANLLKRNQYDNLAIVIVGEIDEYYQFSPTNDMALDYKKVPISSMVANWVNNDTIKNNQLIQHIDNGLKLNDKKKAREKKKVINDLVAFNEDVNNFIFQCNFYEYLFEFENICYTRVKEYKKGLQ